MHKLNSRVEELINLCNFQLFASNNQGNSSHQKLQNCWVAKRLMSPYILFGKVLSFSKIILFLLNYLVYQAQIFTAI